MKRLRKTPPRRDCPVCRAPQAVVVEVGANNDKYQQDGPRVLYLRCTKWGQVQVIEE